MAVKYTKEQLNKLDKDFIIELFLGIQEQLEELNDQTRALNDKMQLLMEILYFLTKRKPSVIWKHRNQTILNYMYRKRKSSLERKPLISQDFQYRESIII